MSIWLKDGALVRSRIRVGAAASFAVLICASSLNQTTGQNPATDEILNRVRQGLNHRHQQMSPIWVRFDLHVNQTKDWWEATRPEKDSGDKRLSYQIAEFAFKGNKCFWKVENIDADLSEWAREDFLVYNGEVEITQSNSPRQYLITRTRTGHQLAEPPLAVVGEDDLRLLLNQWAEGKWKFKKVVATQMTEQGEDLILLDILFPPPGWRNKYWLLPDNDFQVRRYEQYDGNGKPVNKGIALEVSNEKGIPYPTRGKKDHYMGGGKLGFTVDFQVRSIESQPGKIPDSLFIFEFPEDASVYDEDLKVFVRNTDLTESHLAEVIRRAGGHRNLWREWWFLLGLVLTLAACGVAVRRWRRSRN